MGLLGVLYYMFLLTSAASSSSSDAPPITKPNCPTHCGQVEIPFPFGMAPGCYVNDRFSQEAFVFHYWESFKIECNHSFNPPRAFTSTSRNRLEVLKISVMEKTLTVKSPVIFANCTGKPNNHELLMLVETPFSYSVENNFIISVRNCGKYAMLSGVFYNKTTTLGSCVTICENDPESNEICDGVHCCLFTVPSFYGHMEIHFVEAVSSPILYSPGDCKAAFIIAKDRFGPDLTNIGAVEAIESVAAVLEWDDVSWDNRLIFGVENWTDVLNSSTRSRTDNKSIGFSCSEGFEGNPYVINGCREKSPGKSPGKSAGKGKISWKMIVVIAVPIAVSLAFFLIGYWVITKRARIKHNVVSEPGRNDYRVLW